ncbi:MAG TPA: hypothetical protein VLZ77_03720 [Acidimicrobiales bacterium]|nr:hypothetical protein [Acidimicrobiales bacterium]
MRPLADAAVRLLRRPAGRLVAVFGLLPCVLFGVPALAGATWLSGDNLIQNFPLRVLVGVDLRHGHVPVWDPYIWSGSPLLSAFNAGAAYPATWLFAVLPGALAWVANQALVEVVAATGMVVLLRVLGRSWAAAGLGALAYAYGGFMAAQSVHIDLVEAAAWLPWAFAGLDRLGTMPPGRSAAPWVAMLGAAVGLMGLTGAAEPILDAAVVLALYALWLLWRARTRLRVLVRMAVGAGVGLALAGAQLVPGALLQEQSQRAARTYWFFTSGSMNKSFTLLGLDPLLFGTNHSFPVAFYATYNLPEVSSYVGIMAVMGLVGLLARRHRLHPESSRWWIWYGVGGLGLFLAWGDFTPLGHAFYLLPEFNRQRLLARNLMEVDLAVVVLFATWLDHMLLSPAPAPAGPPPRRRFPGPRRWRSDVVLPLVPPLAVVGLQVVMLAGGTWLPHLVGVPSAVTRSSLLPLVGLLTVPSAIAVAAAVVVLRRARLARRMVLVLGVLVVVDLVVFNAFVQGGVNPEAASSSGALWANELLAADASIGPGPAGGLHRMAVFDPEAYDAVAIERLGEADLNILRSLPSVQGYGPVVDARYEDATGAHKQLGLTVSALADGTFARLDLGVLASVPEYFVHLVTAPTTAPTMTVTPGTPIPPVGPSAHAPVDRAPAPPTPADDYRMVGPPAATVALVPGTTRTQFFGTVLSVTAVDVPLAAVEGAGPWRLRVGLLDPDGDHVAWIGAADAAPAPGATLSVAAPGPTPASGIVLEVQGHGPPGPPASVRVGAAVVRTAGQGTYRVDGSLRDAVAPGRWSLEGMVGPFAVFTTRSGAGRGWVLGAPGASVRQVSATPWGDETFQVTTAAPATLVRSEQYASGWQATIATTAPAGGRDTVVHGTVRRQGLVQAVSVPAGTSLVHFTFRPHRVLEGFGLSVLGALAVAGLVAWPRLRRRRRAAPATP